MKHFTTAVKCLEKTVKCPEKISNPFMLEKVTILNNHNKGKFNDNVFEDIKIIETEGEKQFLHFLEKGLVSTELSVQKQKVSGERCFKHKGLWNDTVISH